MKKGILTVVLVIVFISYGMSSCNLPVLDSIRGLSSVCVNSTITLVDTTSSGIWSSSNPGIATVDSLGVVMGIASGNDTIIYSVTNSCGTSSEIYSITVNALPTVNAVSNQVVCAGMSTEAVNFSGSIPGTIYKWTSSNASIGLSAIGSGNICSFAAINNGPTPVVDTITVTPITLTAGTAYITDYSDSTVSVINMATNLVTANILVGSLPDGVSISPDGSKVYVTNAGSNYVSVINTTTNLVAATIYGESEPWGVAMSPDGNKVYVTNNAANTVSVINTATDSVTATINVGSHPIGVAVTPDGSKVYVVNNSSPGSSVSVINTSNDSVTSTIPVGSLPTAVAISPDGSKAYVSGGSNFVSIISTSTDTVTAEINVWCCPDGIAVSPDGSAVYVSSVGLSSVYVISTLTNSVTASISVGTYPEGVSVSPDGKSVYVANAGSNDVSVISTATNLVTNIISVDSFPTTLGNFISASVGCTGVPTTFTITVNPTPNIETLGADTSIDYNPVSLTATGGSTYIWSGGSSRQTATDTFACSGTYVVTVTGSNGCSASASRVVTATSHTTTIAANGAITFCQGGSVTLRTTAGTGYLWSNNDTVQSIVVEQGGNYSVTVTDSNSCTATAIEVVIVNPQPTINAVSSQTLCAGMRTTPVNFSGSNIPTTIYNWTNTDTAIGLAVSGTGNIASFTAVNNSTTPIVAIITATPLSPPGYAYIANQDSGTVSLINTSTNTVVDIVHVGSQAFGVAVSPNGSNVYVSNYGSNTVSVINTASNVVVATINVGSYPTGIAVSPDGSKVYVANESSSNVSVINTATNLVTATIGVGSQPYGVAVSPDGGRVYVASWASETVSIINASTNSVTTSLSMGQLRPYGIAVSPDSTMIYVSNQEMSNVFVVNIVAYQNVAIVNVGNNPEGIVVTPDGSKFYVANSGSNTVSVISTATYLVTSTINVGNAPKGLSLNADGRKLYVANSGSGTISVIDVATNTVIDTITVGAGVNSLGNFVNNVADGCSGTPVSFTITVNPQAISQFGQAICAGSSFRFHSQNLTQAGIYTDTLQTIHGCDSVVSLNLTVSSVLYTDISDSTCQGSEYLFNGYNLTQSGTYLDTLQAIGGCDSVVTLSLTVNSVPQTALADSTCYGMTYLFNGDTLTSAGVYNDTLQTIHGCDSIVTLNLTVSNGAQTALSDTACNGTVIMFKGQSITTTGIYKDTLQTMFGCDSVVTLTLLFDSLPHPTVTRSGDTLQTQVFTAYQWLFGGAEVSNGTTQSIIIQQNGNYSVVVTGLNGCSDTSAVLSVTTLGVLNVTSAYGVKLYPNPNTGSFILEFTDDAVRDVEITDAVGRTVMASTKVSRQQNFNLEEMTAGVYIVRINQQGQVLSLKFTIVR